MTIHYRRIKRIFILLLCVMVISCSSAQIEKYTKVKKPEIRFQQYQIISVSKKQVKVDFLFDVNNPNDIAIDSFFINYVIFVKNKSFIEGRNVKLKLIPKGKSVITVPIDISYKKLLSSASSVAELMVKGKRHLPMSADVEIYGEFKVFEIIKHDFRFQKNINLTIPLPKYSMKDVLQFIQGLR